MSDSRPQFQRKTHRARRALEAVARAYPGAWSAFDSFRRARGSEPDFDWPDWCYLPIAAGYAVATGGGPDRIALAYADRPAILTALGTWRMTQGIYRFDPALLTAVIDTPIEGQIPTDHLQRLPEWCVYVEIPDIDPRLHGAWMHMEYDVARRGQPEFRIVLDTARDPRQPFAADGLRVLAVPLVGTIDDSLDHLARSAHYEATLSGIPWTPEHGAAIRSNRDLVRPLLSMALYLCADADLTRRGRPDQPHNPRPVRSGSGRWTLHPASGPTEWDVGVRIGAALRAAYQREQTGGDPAATGRRVRPHVRRAHWHTILSGARKRPDGSPIPASEQRRDLRWMPPIPVAITDVDALPAVVRPVR